MAYYPRIRDLREDSDKTQREIADYLGTAYQYYAVYEKGTSEIPFERAIALAKYYNVSLDYIAGLTNDKRGLTRSDLTREQQELLRAAAECRSADKTKIAALLKALADAIK
ncbi:MAG: helix-turn-helix domain-containing protein [Prevotella sp.]|nr:helix-turn-helix domain-containing protein [Prevotella sp.]